MAYVDPRRRTNHPVNARSASNTVPPELAIQVLVSDALLVLSICSAKYWLLARGVGSLWLSINVLAGGGIGALAYLVIKGRFAVRGEFPWKTLALASGTLFAQEIALFYSLKRLNASRGNCTRNEYANILLTTSFLSVLFIAPFSALLMQHVIRTHSSRSILLSTTAISVAILIDANFSITDLHKTWTAYLGLLTNGILQVTSHHTSLHLNNAFKDSQVSRAMTILIAATMTIPIHLLGRTTGLLPPYPFVPILALTPLPLLAFVLLYYHPTILSSNSSFSIQGTFQLTFIPTAIFTCVMAPLFSRTLTLSDIPLAILFFYVLRPLNKGLGDPGMGKSASEPVFRLFQGYLNTILSNPESRKIFYFLVVNMAYMLVQMLYGVWTNSLGLISDAIHMAFDCMAIAMGLFASVMATWTPNERFTYGYSRIETLSGFANGIFLILISVFIIVEAIQRLLDPPEMNTRQLLLVSTVGLAVNLFGMFAMGGHHHHGHSHSHGGHAYSEDTHSENAGHGHEGHAHTGHEGHSHGGHDRLDDLHTGHEGHLHGSHAHSEDARSGHEGHSHDNHESDPSHASGHGAEHSHSHNHDDNSHSHSHEHEGHSHDQGHDDHSHSHTRPTIQTPPYSAEFRLESPTDDKHMGYGYSSVPTPSLYTPATPSSLPFSPMTPSYSFVHDHHLETHHADTAHSHTHSAAHEGHSHNMRGVFLHVMADTLGSVGVILSTILINIYGWTGFDPIASLFIAILIAASVVPLVMDTGRVLALDLGGKEGEVERALQEISGIMGVQSYSDARFWPLEQSRIVGSIHVQVMPGYVSGRRDTDSITDRRGPTKLDRLRDSVEHVLKSRIKGLEELVVQLDG